jgi:hypothetical protein
VRSDGAKGVVAECAIAAFLQHSMIVKGPTHFGVDDQNAAPSPAEQAATGTLADKSPS